MRARPAVVALLLAWVACLFLAGGGPAAGRQLSAAIVFDEGSTPTEQDAIGQSYRAFLDAVRRYGVKGHVALIDPQKDPTTLLESLARRRYDLIISAVLGPDVVGPVAAKFPSSRFLIPDETVADLGRRLSNVEGAVFHSEQGAYLAGYLAALVERRAGGNVVSSVGGFKFPGVDAFIAGYQAGARKADPGIRTLKTYTGDFLDPSKCRAAALDQITRGSGVVFPVAGFCSIGALRAAMSRHVWAIGVDVDESGLGPQILTSALKQNGRPISEAIRQLSEGKLKMGGDLVYNLRNGGVGLGKISPKVPRALVARVDAVRRQIIAGTIKVPAIVR